MQCRHLALQSARVVEIPNSGLESVVKFLPTLRHRPRPCLHLPTAFRCSHSHCLHSFHLFLPALTLLILLVQVAPLEGLFVNSPIYYLAIPFKAIRGLLPSSCWEFGYLQG